MEHRFIVAIVDALIKAREDDARLTRGEQIYIAEEAVSAVKAADEDDDGSTA